MNSDLSVPVLSFGTATFGGTGEFFKAWGQTDVKEAGRLIDICLEHSVNFVDTANVYSHGLSEEILGAVLKGRRQHIQLSTKATFRMGEGPDDAGSSRRALTKALEASLRRLGTDVIDLYYMHGFDANTPVEETLGTLADFVKSGKVRAIGCSNFSGWHLMKSLAISDKSQWPRYIAHQAYYSLMGREFEWELMPLALDQGVSTVVWSPMAGGALSGKIRRDQAPPSESRSAQMDFVVSAKSERLHDIVDVLAQVAEDCGRSVAQVALNWVLSRPTVASIVIGARNEEQLRQNLGAVGWQLTANQIEKLDRASQMRPVYPYWHQLTNPDLVPSPVKRYLLKAQS